MATIQHRGARQYQASICIKGFARLSRTFETKADAENWAKRVESEMNQGSYVDRREAERTTLGQALTRYAEEITPQKKVRSLSYPRYAVGWRTRWHFALCLNCAVWTSVNIAIAA